MSNDLEAFALKSTLIEVKNACPDVSHAFIFKDDDTILATTEETNEETATQAAKTFNAMSKRANTVGGLESATFYSTNNRMNIFHVNDYYLAVVGSEEADEKNSADLTRILIPTVLRLTEKISDFSREENLVEKPRVPEVSTSTVEESSTDLAAEELTVEEQVELDEPRSLLPEPPVTQFMVENVNGLYKFSDKFSDTIRIDSGVIQQWKDLYGEREITEVELETLNGQTTRCKFKPIKDSKHDGKGTIQIPQRIQQTLQTSKGELITIKPVIE